MARVFNGADANYLSIPNPTGAIDITGNNFTVSAWVRATALASGQRVCGKDSQTVTTPRGWNLHVYTSNVWRFEILDAAGGGYSFTAPGTAGAWVHLCGVHNSGARCSLYVNGVEAAGSNQTRVMADTAWDFTIGRNPYVSASAFNGQIAEVAIWRASLTAAEVALLAKGLSPYIVRPANLAGYWPLWGCGPTALTGETDISGGLEHLSMVGSVGFSADHPPMNPLVLQ